uniref:Uncharacterized protein n=1 Tax=Gossypium raimondii TaxID=29730 RepID=A0A0D2TEG4_GOSRA|nr:hypothetical protein B456_007G135100 [Gossypium raimondii]
MTQAFGGGGGIVSYPPHVHIFNSFPYYKRGFKFFHSLSNSKENLTLLAHNTQEVVSVRCFLPMRSMKGRSWQRCSKQIREQRGRLYIIWRCTVLLLCWHD